MQLITNGVGINGSGRDITTIGGTATNGTDLRTAYLPSTKD